MKINRLEDRAFAAWEEERARGISEISFEQEEKIAFSTDFCVTSQNSASSGERLYKRSLYGGILAKHFASKAPIAMS